MTTPDKINMIPKHRGEQSPVRQRLQRFGEAAIDYCKQAETITSKAIGAPLLVEGIKATRETWADRPITEKAGAVAAHAVTLGGLVGSVAEACKAPENRTAFDAAAIVALALADGLDGFIARKTKGITPSGKIVDPLADKLTSWATEIIAAQRGGISSPEVAVRILRDMIVTYYRDYATEQTHGEIDISATPKTDPLSGKYSTTLRKVAQITTIAAEHDIVPKRASTVINLGATAYLLLTGVANVARINRALTEYQQHHTSQEIMTTNPSIG